MAHTYSAPRGTRMTDPLPKHLIFQRSRRRLLHLAQRVLGHRGEAEEVVQEAYLRLHDADASALASCEAWLATVTLRLCLDSLRQGKARQGLAHGLGVLDALLGGQQHAPDQAAEAASEARHALRVLLERLAPHESAALLLHDVFGFDYGELAELLGRSEPACRQVVHRARTRVRMAGRRPPQAGPDRPLERGTANPPDEAQVERYMHAIRSADRRALMALLQGGLAGQGGPVRPGQRVTLTKVHSAAGPAWRIELGGAVLAVVPQQHLAWWTGDCDAPGSTLAEPLTIA